MSGLLASACFTGEILGAGAPGAGATPAPGPAAARPPAGAWWHPKVGVTWQWQLQGNLDMSKTADVYDVDLFTTTAENVAALHARGAKVVCYISVGSWEDWRPDKDKFPAEVLGKAYVGWPGERWLDIRQIDKLGPVMGARLDLCRDKGFDAVEPDNIDAFETKSTGFPLTAADQLAYNRWLTEQAHARGLSIGLKNDPEQASALEPAFDWALTESCYAQEDWCDTFSVFVDSGKPVLMAEYTDEKVDWQGACSRAHALSFSAILKRLKLDGWVQSCP